MSKILFVVNTDFGVINTRDEAINQISDKFMTDSYDIFPIDNKSDIRKVRNKVKDVDMVIYIDQTTKGGLRDEMYIKELCRIYDKMMLKYMN